MARILFRTVHLLFNLQSFCEHQSVSRIWSSYLDGIFFWIIYFMCLHRSFNKLVLCTSNALNHLNRILVLNIHLCVFINYRINSKYLLRIHQKYLNRILIPTIHLLCVHRWLNQLRVFASNSVKYINRILLWNIYLLRVRRLGINSKSLLGIQ